AQQMNRLIHAVREQNLSRIESEKISGHAFHWRALGIACQGFGIQRTQPYQHTRRAPDRAFVEVKTQEIKTQSLTSSQGRPIGMQTLHGGAGLKHKRTSLATTQRVRASPRLRPASSPVLRCGESLRAKLPGTKRCGRNPARSVHHARVPSL